MFILIEQSELVARGFAAGFEREGVPLVSFSPMDFMQWIDSTPESELQNAEAFMIGNCERAEKYSKIIRRHTRAPIIALRDQTSLEFTLALFEAGADDVVKKPVNARELLARVEAVRRRVRSEPEATTIGKLKVYFDGRYPEIEGEPFPLPRRERRILEVLVAHRGRWMTKQQVFAATYGMFDDEVQESVVESHVSKLRRKLTNALGSDPVEAKRFLGYRIDVIRPKDMIPPGHAGHPRSMPVEAYHVEA